MKLTTNQERNTVSIIPTTNQEWNTVSIIPTTTQEHELNTVPIIK